MRVFYLPYKLLRLAMDSSVSSVPYAQTIMVQVPVPKDNLATELRDIQRKAEIEAEIFQTLFVQARERADSQLHTAAAARRNPAVIQFVGCDGEHARFASCA